MGLQWLLGPSQVPLVILHPSPWFHLFIQRVAAPAHGRRAGRSPQDVPHTLQGLGKVEKHFS